ncbi:MULTISPECIES: DMT family transporter [unclassified Crossiella]|uniref:DMT family transporter n=1 Tax=unclassified Crossiella TaxID=2620835 RepID=UPI001FFF2313|nr:MULTISPECIES: DMT family transporter [unclassified Crossiella]MCK2244458.1 DMT family transporter [Crossiella sp. S99.2]MCK2258089.1 DMT family transporter [Crossiella sp. S99.1]
MTAIVLVLLAAIAHALWNFAAKRAGDGGAPFVWLYQVASVLICGPVAVLAFFLGDTPARWTWLLAVAVSAVLHAVYALVLQRGYAVGEMSVVYPVARGSGPLLTVLAAVLVLGERPGWAGLLGAAAIVGGVFVIGLGPSSQRGALNTSLAYGGLTGVAIASYTLWDAYSVTTLAVPPLIYFCLGSLTQSLLLAPVALRQPARVAAVWRAYRTEVLVVAVLSPLGYVLVLYAMRLAPLSVVAPVRELSIVLGALLAWRWFGEANPVRRLIGAALVLAGIALVATA